MQWIWSNVAMSWFINFSTVEFVEQQTDLYINNVAVLIDVDRQPAPARLSSDFNPCFLQY